MVLTFHSGTNGVFLDMYSFIVLAVEGCFVVTGDFCIQISSKPINQLAEANVVRKKNCDKRIKKY